jgi:hypothetical protein
MSPASWSPSHIEAIRTGRAGRSRLVGLTASIATRMAAGDDQPRIGVLPASLAIVPLTCAFGAPRGIRTPNRQIRRLVLYVHPVRLSAVGAAQVRCQIQLDRLSPVW